MGVFSQYCSNPGPTNCNLVIQIFRYFSRTFKLGITFTANLGDDLVDYIDSDYVGLMDGQNLQAVIFYAVWQIFISLIEVAKYRCFIIEQSKIYSNNGSRKESIVGCTIFGLSRFLPT